MARIWSCGFELNTVTDGIEWNQSIGTPVVQSTTVRSGVYALQVPSLTTLTAKGIRARFAAAAGNGPYFVRVYFRVATLPLLETSIIQLNDTANSFTTPMVWITLDSAGALLLKDEDGTIGSASSALSTNTWYRIGLRVDLTGGAGAHVVEAQVNGTTFATSSTRSLSAGVQMLGLGGNMLLEANATANWYFDDVSINDSSGSFQNTYAGEGEIILLRPNGNGDNSGWAGSDGNSTDNYLLVDEVTPNDVTDYVESNTSGQIDDYNIEDTPAAMDSTDVINLVAVGVRLAVSDATGNDPDIVLRVKASAAGTVEESATIDVNNTVYTTNNSGNLVYLHTLYDLPGASTTGWTKADLDQAQIGVRESVTDTHFARISTIWLLVEHKPGTAKSLVYNPQRRNMLGLLPR